MSATVQPPGSAPSVAAPPRDSVLRAWWREPRLVWWVWLVLAALLFLRKPHALHTPQLWAEDGSIFLTFNDLDGVGAWKTPYMGYLHTLPRLIASAAGWLLDPAWWPAFYNGVSFVLWLAVIARTFSPRLDLPGKPWLALAFILGPHTGEILFNITNLHWITAFVFVQQVLIARPQTHAQRFGDLALLVLVGLTGPFVIPFVPLFVWRLWRERDGDTLAALAVVTACAAVQGWFIVHTGPKFDYQALPFRTWAGLEVIARRLIVWPLVGDRLAFSLPRWVVIGLGVTLATAAVAWTLRPHPRRLLRLQLLVMLLVILGAGIHRARPDVWPKDDLIFGDRYFYMPRVLFVWLLILEFDAAPRLVAWLARALCFAMAAAHVPGYMLRAPKDYHWKQHVEPIRRGEPANIPILPENWTLEYRGRKK